MDNSGDVYYGDIAKDYESHNVGKKLWEVENKVVGGFIKQIQPSTVLDIAVGTGRFFETYKEMGAKVTGIDISEDMLVIAKDKSESLSFPVELLKEDVHELKPSKKFECVVCFRFFAFIEDLDAMIKTLKDQSKKYIIVSVWLNEKVDKILFEPTGRAVHGYEYFFRVLEKHDIKVWDTRIMPMPFELEKKYHVFLLRKNNI